jgi:hypothetical protein
MATSIIEIKRHMFATFTRQIPRKVPRLEVPMHSPIRAILLTIASLTLGCSSTSNSLPGTSLGTYSVTGPASTNTCGTALGAPAALDITVDLSEDGTTLYWSWGDGTDPISGTLASSATTITATTNNVVQGSAATCSLVRADTVSITLAAGATPASFTGTISYAYSVANNGTCPDQLTSGGGGFSALPCTIAYAITGNRQ